VLDSRFHSEQWNPVLVMKVRLNNRPMQKCLGRTMNEAGYLSFFSQQIPTSMVYLKVHCPLLGYLNLFVDILCLAHPLSGSRNMSSKMKCRGLPPCDKDQSIQIPDSAALFPQPIRYAPPSNPPTSPRSTTSNSSASPSTTPLS
jgi:hypothetical protein